MINITQLLSLPQKCMPDTAVEDYQTFTYQARQIEEMVNVYFRRAYWRKRVDPEKKEVRPLLYDVTMTSSHSYLQEVTDV